MGRRDCPECAEARYDECIACRGERMEQTHDPETGEDLRCVEMGHDEEIIFDDGTYVQWRCRRCEAEGDYTND